MDLHEISLKYHECIIRSCRAAWYIFVIYLTKQHARVVNEILWLEQPVIFHLPERWVTFVGGDPDVQPTSTVNKQGRVRPYFYSGFFQQILWALPLIQMCQNDPMAQTKIHALNSVAYVWKILPRNNNGDYIDFLLALHFCQNESETSWSGEVFLTKIAHNLHMLIFKASHFGEFEP